MNTLLISGLIYRNYNLNSSVQTSLFPAYILTAVRQIIRIIDLEQTKLIFSEKQWFELAIL
jgi:hypothetical protein